MDSKNKE